MVGAMSDVEITISLPEALVKRARAISMNFEDQAEAITAAVENEISCREAAKRLLEFATELDALPDEMKPTSEEIDAARRDYWTKNPRK